MPKPAYPNPDWRVTALVTFSLAALLLLLRTWQLAFLAGFVGGMLTSRASRAFLLGALSVAFAWAGWLIALYDVYPAFALSELVVQVLGLGAAFWWLLPFLTLLLGFLTGGLGALTGHFGARLFLWAEPVPVASPKA